MRFSTYQEVLKYLYENLPMFQRQGAAAFRKDLNKTLQLDELLNYPHQHFKSIHIAGTNGKGSTAHMLAAICQQEGYKTGLYTSPHLREFTERIKINGKPMSPGAVLNFINKYFDAVQDIKPSFFEITLAMAFQHFKDEMVDIAIVETGMGGRLDSTNIVTPVLSIITNVSYDHQQFLGETLQEIAGEKAGIIKHGIPIVISERQQETEHVFLEKSRKQNAPLIFADEACSVEITEEGFYRVMEDNKEWPEPIQLPLLGNYQMANLRGVLAACKVLNEHHKIQISQSSIYTGLKDLSKLTGLKGRYQIINEHPKVICDVGHNEAGLEVVFDQLLEEEFEKLYIVLGVVNDKDLEQLWAILPKDAYYLFTQADIPRALPAKDLAQQALKNGFTGKIIDNVPGAYEMALSLAGEHDLVFIGGSTFTVAEINDLYDEE